MTRPHGRLVSVWEGDPVGVDTKRPLLGFALVALLCAVLMMLSVGRSWSLDFLQPGKPIASTMGGRVERVPAPAPDAAESIGVGFPVELSAQPLAAPPPAAARTTVATGTTARTALGRAEAKDRLASRSAARAEAERHLSSSRS